MARAKRTARRAPSSARRPLAADPVFEALAGAILRGKYQPGSPLPPERELSALFDVSRLIVRQALHRLREMGLASGGQGGQNIVLDPDASSDPRIVALTMELAPEKTDQQDVIERQLLGGTVMLELAQSRITDAQIDALAELLDGVEKRPDRRDIGDFETAFWTAIAAASGNKILLREARWWFEMLSRQPDRARWFYDRPEFRLPAYRMVVDSLRARDQKAASRFLESVRPLLGAR
jgi:DNA-binding FadR family transcriptional regulator